MEIKINEFYANDHSYEDGYGERNIILVTNIRQNNDIEVNSTFYDSETMYIIGDKVESIHTTSWLPEFLKRKATKEEVALFLAHRSNYDKLVSWSEELVDNYLNQNK